MRATAPVKPMKAKSPFGALLKSASPSPGPSPSPSPSPSPNASPDPARPKPTRSDEHEREPPLELDIASRNAVLLAPPPMLTTPTAPSPTQAAPIDPHLAAELVEKAAFWGDGTRGLARLRFGGKARAGLANATVTLEHDGDEVFLRVEGVDDATADHLREMLALRGVRLRET